MDRQVTESLYNAYNITIYLFIASEAKLLLHDYMGIVDNGW